MFLPLVKSQLHIRSRVEENVANKDLIMEESNEKMVEHDLEERDWIEGEEPRVEWAEDMKEGEEDLKDTADTEDGGDEKRKSETKEQKKKEVTLFY